MEPITFDFVAVGVQRFIRTRLTAFRPAQMLDFKWEGRNVLTDIVLKRLDGKTLTINDATVSISREKRIVSTVVTGLDGTIKEYVSNGDYSIKLSVGIIALMGGVPVDEYPREGIREIREFLEENRSIGVSSVFFSLFGISRMVVTKFSLNQDTHSSRQEITVDAVSDVDYIIKDTEY